jgi:hypothetical protein
MTLERSSVFEAAQIGPELLSAPGVAVSASKRLQALGLALKPKIEVERYRPFGSKYDTLLIPGKDWTTVDVTGRLDYSNVIYPLASVVNSPEVTTVGTNGRKWSFVSQGYAPDVPQTYTVDAGSALRAQRATNVIFTDFSMAFRRASVELSGTAIGKLFTDGVDMTGNAIYTLSIVGTVSGGTYTLTYSGQTTSAIPYNASADTVAAALYALNNIRPGDVIITGGPTPTTNLKIVFTGSLGFQPITLTATFTGLTPAPGASAVTSTQVGTAVTSITALPVIPGSVDIFLDATSGALGTTKLDRVFQADVAISSRYNPMWVLNSANTSWVSIVETAPDVTLKLKLAANGTGMALLSTLRASTTVFLRVESVGPAMPAPDAAQNYLFRLDMAAKIETPDDLGDNEGSQAIDFTFRGVQDATWGKLLEFTVQNLLTAL